MADEVAMNGGDCTLDISENEDPKASKLIHKIETIEQEKVDLVHENEAVRERITKLEGEIEVLENEKAELSREIASSDADKKSLEAAAARASELEIEVSKLQHKENKEVIDLKREVEKLKESGNKMREDFELLEREKDSILKQLGEAEEDLRNKAGEERVEELTKKLEDLEGREKDLIAEIGEKEIEIRELKKGVEEIEKLKKERDELEGAKSWLEGLLEKSEKRVKEMEENIGQLGKELEVSELVISGLKEKTLDGINGIHIVEDGEKGMYGPKLQWSVLAVSTGLVVTIGALWYLRVRQR